MPVTCHSLSSRECFAVYLHVAVYTERTPREHRENTERTPREHRENTERTAEKIFKSSISYKIKYVY